MDEEKNVLAVFQIRVAVLVHGLAMFDGDIEQHAVIVGKSKTVGREVLIDEDVLQLLERGAAERVRDGVEVLLRRKIGSEIERVHREESAADDDTANEQTHEGH